ncbi:MAG TPA: lysylphosphatidylglycerol synthase transmembrane domain-containing protein [Chloroflexota bacterium]|nr:lysylphosphatidylglycerol synthase transmembrane domain-containing protein [Chloroflexota bacterium]
MSPFICVLKRAWPKLRPWLPFVAAGALLYFMVAAVNPTSLAEAARGFNPIYLAPLAGSYLLYLAFRSARWHLLMKPLQAPNSWTDSLLLFAAAQSAVMVPAGQFLLPVLQKSQHGTLIRRSAATVLVQEIIFAILVLPAALPGILGYEVGGWLLLAAAVISVGSGALILHEGVANICLFIIHHLPLVSHHGPHLRDLRNHIVLVVNTREAVLGSVFDLLAIAAAGTGFYIALVGIGQAHIGWVGAIGTYAIGNAAATVTALPGGLGANEDASVGVLSHLGLAPGPAAAATLIFRAVTLLLGTALGWLVLLLCRQRFKMHTSLALLLAAAAKGSQEAHSEQPLLTTPP